MGRRAQRRGRKKAKADSIMEICPASRKKTRRKGRLEIGRNNSITKKLRAVAITVKNPLAQLLFLFPRARLLGSLLAGMKQMALKALLAL